MGLTPTEAWGLAAWSLPFLGLVVLAWKRGGIVAVSGLGIVFAAVGWIAYWLLAEGPPRYAFVGVLPIFLATLGALTLAGISYNRLERPSGLRFVHRGGLLVGLAVTPGLWLAGSASERFSVVEYVLVCVMTMLATDLVVVACSSGQRARWAAAIAAFLYVTALAFGTRGRPSSAARSASGSAARASSMRRCPVSRPCGAGSCSTAVLPRATRAAVAG